MAIGLQDAERTSRRKAQSADQKVAPQAIPLTDRPKATDAPEPAQPWTSHGHAKRGRSLAKERRPEGDPDPNWWLEAEATWLNVQRPLVVERWIRPLLELESSLLGSPLLKSSLLKSTLGESSWLNSPLLNEIKKPATWLRRLSLQVAARPGFKNSFRVRDQK